MEPAAARSSPKWLSSTIRDARCLTVLLRPVSTYTIFLSIALIAIKYMLSYFVVDQNDGKPFADDTKVFGLFVILDAMPLIACFYSKRTFWFNPHVDYLILYTPILVAGPLIWRFTIMSFTEALYLLFIALSLMPTLFTPLMFWDKNMSFGQIMKLSVSQSIVFWILMVFTSSIHLLFLSLSRMNYGSGTIVDLFSSVCLFGVVFPILRTVATQGARRGLKLYDMEEPTNVQEYTELKRTIFRYIVCLDIFWNALSHLLLTEIRDNATFSISVVCSHIVTILTRVLSVAAFRRLQRERMGKTAPILSRAYDHIQTDITIKSAGRPSVVKTLNVESKEDSIPNYMNRKVAGRNSLAKSYHVTLKDESLPGYGNPSSSPNTPDNQNAVPIFDKEEDISIDFSPTSSLPDFTPMSDETRFAFTNLAQQFGEYCSRISSFLITLFLTSLPPQSTWTHCRDPLTVQTHVIRGIITMTVSFFIDAVVLWVERRVDEDGLREAVEEFRMARVSWLVYLEMVMHVLGVCGAFVMAMPGVLQNGDGCFKGGRKGWG